MNGMRPATSGNVMINDIDLYRHLDTFKHTIGYVPQEDIIHRELSVYRTLYYVAKLRLSRDVSRKEIDQIINEVLDVTGLAESRNIPVRELSGGQRKRVSIAVELITKPSVIYLDEPTSGLDPATEDKIMRLFKQIAESGRTIVMTTHAMENVKLFDKIVVLMRGKLAFYGTPEDALKHLHAASYKELFDKLEAPVREGVKQHGEANRANLTDRTAEEWRQKFLRTPQYKQLVHDPLSELGKLQKTGVRKRRRLGLFGAIGQWITLSRRYVEVLLKDKFNLAILLLQAPIIALMTFLVMGANQPRDFLYFVLSLVAVWFGTSVAAREIVREQPVYKRERMFNLGILPYLASKLFILGLIVFLQCLLLFVPLKFFDLIGLMLMPGELGGLPQLSAMLVTAAVGVALGLLVSALVRTSEMATSLVPLLLIPQLLFSGLTGVPSGINKVVGLTMPAAWAFDTMKRFSTLDTLEPEGANPKGKTKGLGLIKSIEAENEKILEDAKRDLEDYKKISGGGQYQDDASTSNSGNTLADKLEVPEMKKIPEDLSGYVTFLHPWMGDVLNQLVLMLMFWMLVIITLIVLKLKDLV
jgi:ABC-type multidrug transport system ATPase subunit